MPDLVCGGVRTVAPPPGWCRSPLLRAVPAAAFTMAAGPVCLVLGWQRSRSR